MIDKGHFILFSREEFYTWLKSKKVNRKIVLIQNHHTWKPNYSNFKGNNHFDLLESMRNFHINDRKFEDIAQNITTLPDGMIALSKGRDLDRIPAGIKGFNSNGICIEHLGDFDLGGDKMTEEHKKTILFLNAILCEKFNLTIDINSIVYHHWYDLNSGKRIPDEKINSDKLSDYETKTCCGTNFFGGNKVSDAKKLFIPLVQQEYNNLFVKGNDNVPNTKYTPQIVKERIYSENGKLKYVDLKEKSPYATKATDVRWIKFEKDKIRLDFIYEKGAKVSELVKKYKADYGFNFPFFYNGIPLGDVRDQDKVIASAYGKMLKWHEFAYRNGAPMIGQLNKNEPYDFLVQASPMLVENGKLVHDYYIKYDETAPDIVNTRCQRTFIGIDAKGDFHLFIGDGRTNTDQGLSLFEAALYATSKQCIFVLNGDGGGSTILADKNGGLNQKLNTGTNERVVHHAVLVYLK